MAIHFYLQRPVNEKVRANGFTTAVTIHRTRTTSDELISAVAAQGAVSTANVVAVFKAMSEFMAREIANGSVVELPGVGTFREDVRGVVEPQLPTTKGKTMTKTHVRTSPIFKSMVARYLNALQVPKVIPAPEFQVADTTLKQSIVPPEGFSWGPIGLPSDTIMVTPGGGIMTIKGKNLIWDTSRTDEGLFVATGSPEAVVSGFTKVLNGSILGRRGRSISFPVTNLPTSVSPNFTVYIEVRSRLGSRDLRTTSYRIRVMDYTKLPEAVGASLVGEGLSKKEQEEIVDMWEEKVENAHPVLVAPVGMSQQSLTLDVVELTAHPDPSDTTAAQSSPFPQQARETADKQPTASRSRRKGLEEQIAVNEESAERSSFTSHPRRGKVVSPSEPR